MVNIGDYDFTNHKEINPQLPENLNWDINLSLVHDN